MNSIQSIYASAKNNYGEQSLIGLNKNCKNVVIHDTLSGLEKVYDDTIKKYEKNYGKEYGKTVAEKTVGPQSKESSTNKSYILFGRIEIN